MLQESSKRLHILMLPSFYPDIDNPSVGIFIRDQANALYNYGINVGVVFAELRRLSNYSFAKLRENHFQTSYLNENGIRTVRLKSWNPLINTRVGSYIWTYLMQRLINIYVHRYGKPDLIHAHCTFWSGNAAHIANIRHGIPYVLTEHSSAFMEGKLANYSIKSAKRILSSASAVIAVSSTLARQLSQYCSGTTPHIIGNMVDTSFFFLPTVQRSREPFNFLFIGALDSNKACDLVIAAFSKAFSYDDNVSLTIVGRGPFEAKYRHYAKISPLESKISFSGHTSREYIRNHLLTANCLISSSYIETFGIVLIEALSCGIPVIATRSGGPQDIMVSDSLGLLVDTGSSDQLAEAMIKVIREYDNYKPEVLRNEVIRRYSQASICSLLHKVYSSALPVNMVNTTTAVSEQT